MKMKKLKNVWLFLSFILMVAGMASCSTEDPTGVEVSREDIIGTWKVTANDWTNSEEESNRNDHVGQTLSVRRDGTASFRGESFNWTLSKGVLTLSDNRGRNIRVVILSYTEEEIQASYDLRLNRKCTLRKAITPSSACNETYYYKKSHSNVAFFVGVAAHTS